jgi:hypothetical protein
MEMLSAHAPTLSMLLALLSLGLMPRPALRAARITASLPTNFDWSRLYPVGRREAQ